MASQQTNREELDERARQGETMVPSGTGGKSLEAQEHLAEDLWRVDKEATARVRGYHEMGIKGGQTRKEQMGREGYQEMGCKGGLSSVVDKSGAEHAEVESIEIDESKVRNN